LSVAVIEFNDLGIEVSIDGEFILASPGYAVMDGNKLLLGQEAMDNARLLPRFASNQFWDQLSSEPTAIHLPGIRHQADLAFAHLEKIWQDCCAKASRPTEVIFAVPGYYAREQLGLLLGMAKEADIPVCAMVDAGLLSVAGQTGGGPLLHLDASLHRVVLTVLEADTFISHRDTRFHPQGINHFREKWASVIARQMIEHTRFDPLRQAHSEQKLFDMMPAWIASLTGGNSSQTFDLALANQSWQVTITTDHLLSASSDIYPKIIQLINTAIKDHQSLQPARLYVSHRLAGVPGMMGTIDLIKHLSSQTLGPETLRMAANSRLAELKSHDPGVSLILKLSRHDSPALQGVSTNSVAQPSPVNGPTGADGHSSGITSAESAREAPPSNRTMTPTHLLHNNVATAIGQEISLSSNFSKGLVAGSDAFCAINWHQQTLTLKPLNSEVTLNNLPLTREAPLVAGDVIGFQGQQITAIVVGND